MFGAANIVKMVVRLKSIGASFMAFLGLLVCSCSSIPSESVAMSILVGIWEAPAVDSNGNMYRKRTEFTADGSFRGKTIGRPASVGGDRTFVGRWTVEGGYLVYLNVISSDGVLESHDIRDRLLQLSADRFRYRNQFGSVQTYLRVRQGPE